MTNIPRRKIYETMLDFEDIMIDMQIMLYNKENFDKFLPTFNSEKLPGLNKTFVTLKSLFVIFFENKKFENEEEYEEYLNHLSNLENDTRKKIIENKNLPKPFIDVILLIEKKIKKFQNIEKFIDAQEFYDTLDKFNHYVPKILEIRRDQMR